MSVVQYNVHSLLIPFGIHEPPHETHVFVVGECQSSAREWYGDSEIEEQLEDFNCTVRATLQRRVPKTVAVPVSIMLCSALCLGCIFLISNGCYNWELLLYIVFQ